MFMLSDLLQGCSDKVDLGWRRFVRLYKCVLVHINIGNNDPSGFFSMYLSF